MRCAGLETVQPLEGLRVLQSLLASALLSHTAPKWPAAFLAGHIYWQALLGAPSRARAALYAGFQVRAFSQLITWHCFCSCTCVAAQEYPEYCEFINQRVALQVATQASASHTELPQSAVVHLHPDVKGSEHTRSLLTAIVESVLGFKPPLDQPLMEVHPVIPSRTAIKATVWWASQQ